MTAPTQPPDPRVERIAKALAANKLSLITSVALARVLVEELGGRDANVAATTQPPDPRVPMTRAEKIKALDEAMIPTGLREMARERFATVLVDVLAPDARVLVEELGGRDANVAATEIDPRIVGWMDVCKTLDDVDPTWSTRYNSTDAAILAIRQLAAQQRENAETIKELKERVETAEAANTELDNARNSAEQSARDLRENNATLRAELDAIKGAQVPYRWAVVGKDRMSFTFTSLESAQTWANGEGGEVIPLYRHHAPALPVVGACVVRHNGAVGTYTLLSFRGQVECENTAQIDARSNGGNAYRLYRDVTPLSTEGGK